MTRRRRLTDEEKIMAFQKDLDRRARGSRCVDCGSTPEPLPYRDIGFLCHRCVRSRVLRELDAIIGPAQGGSA